MLLVNYLVDFSQLNLVYAIMHANVMNVMNIRFFGGIKVALVRISDISLPIIGQQLSMIPQISLSWFY